MGTPSIYEKESIYDEFISNHGIYNNNTLTDLKKKFYEEVANSYPPPSTGIPDPFTPSETTIKKLIRKSKGLSMSEELNEKFEEPTPAKLRKLPQIKIYKHVPLATIIRNLMASRDKEAEEKKDRITKIDTITEIIHKYYM